MAAQFLIPAAASLIGGLFSSSAAAKQQREANRLARAALNDARKNYSERSPFRDASVNALSTGARDWSSLYDPSLYRSEDIPYSTSQRTQNARGAAQSAFAKTQGIDRTANIREALRDFDIENEPIFEANARRVGQRASQFGALGKGTINTELGELEARRARDRNLLQNDLIRESEERNVDDAYRALEATREEERMGLDADEAAYARALGERERRTTLGRQGLLDQLMLGGENRAEQQAQLARALGLAGVGFGNDPSGAAFQGAGFFQNNANNSSAAASQNWDALGDILASYYARNRGGNTFGPPNTSRPRYVTPGDERQG